MGKYNPHYRGYSILNVPSSICGWLGAPQLGAIPLDPQITISLADEYQNVILILMDALSLRRFTQWAGAGVIPVWSEADRAGCVYSPDIDHSQYDCRSADQSLDGKQRG